jgi:hypothetical protein
MGLGTFLYVIFLAMFGSQPKQNPTAPTGVTPVPETTDAGATTLQITQQQYQTWKAAAAKAAAANAKVETSDLPVFIVDYNVMPSIATHTQHAIDSGINPVLNRTTDPVQMAANYAVACGNMMMKPLSCDEFPFRSTMQGAASGGPYSIAAVPPRENSLQGGLLSWFYRKNNVCHGCPFLVMPINVPPNEPPTGAVQKGWAGP